MKIGFVYGGQGSQIEGMGKDLYARYSFVRDFYDSIQGDFSIKEMSFQGDLETISKTEFTQPLLLAFQIAMTKILDHHAIGPDILMGLSLGEYAALYAGGVLNEREALEIIQFRGKEMSKAAEGIDTKMLAVFSDDIEGIDKLCKKHSSLEKFVQISNINTQGQLVISGEGSLVSKVAEELKLHKYKSKELNTSGPFHTSYMDSVSRSLYEYFNTIDFKSPKIPIIYNSCGDFNKEEDPRVLMSRQVNNRVLFKSSLEVLISERPDLIIEIGFKDTIKAFIKRIDKDIKVIAVNNIESIEGLLREVENDRR